MNILGVFCVIVLLLSIWWFFLITKIIYIALTTGVQEDLQNKIEDDSDASSLK